MSHEHVTLQNCDLFPLPRLAVALSSGSEWEAVGWDVEGPKTDIVRSTGAKRGFATDDVTAQLARAFITGNPIGHGKFETGRRAKMKSWHETRSAARQERLERCYQAGWNAFDKGMPYELSPYADRCGKAWSAGWADNADGWFGRTKI